MDLKNSRKSKNVQTVSPPKEIEKDGRTFLQAPSTKTVSTEAHEVLPGTLAREQLYAKRTEKVGRAMGVGNQLDAIEAAGKDAKFFKHTIKDNK